LEKISLAKNARALKTEKTEDIFIGNELVKTKFAN
jgi:hypothetical protein